MIVRTSSNSRKAADRSASRGQFLSRDFLPRAPSSRKPVEKAIDILLENFAPQPVEVVPAVLPHVNQTRVIKDLDVIRDRRLRDRQRVIENGAGELIRAGDHPHDLDANRLAERAENLRVRRLSGAGHARMMVVHSAWPAGVLSPLHKNGTPASETRHISEMLAKAAVAEVE